MEMVHIFHTSENRYWKSEGNGTTGDKNNAHAYTLKTAQQILRTLPNKPLVIESV